MYIIEVVGWNFYFIMYISRYYFTSYIKLVKPWGEGSLSPTSKLWRDDPINELTKFPCYAWGKMLIFPYWSPFFSITKTSFCLVTLLGILFSFIVIFTTTCISFPTSIFPPYISCIYNILPIESGPRGWHWPGVGCLVPVFEHCQLGSR